MNVEQGTFTPLIFTIYGGYGPECLAFHKHLADKIVDKTGVDYAKVLTFTKFKISLTGRPVYETDRSFIIS